MFSLIVMIYQSMFLFLCLFCFLIWQKQASISSCLSGRLLVIISSKVDQTLRQQSTVCVKLFHQQMFAHLQPLIPEKIFPSTAIKSIFSKHLKDNNLITDQQRKTFIQIKTARMTSLAANWHTVITGSRWDVLCSVMTCGIKACYLQRAFRENIQNETAR